MKDYVALIDIPVPGTSVFGYRRGHAVPESVVQNWELAVGEQVAEGTQLPEDDESGATMGRPGPEATRATWEKWAVANGMSQEDAAVAAQEALEKVEAKKADAEPSVPDDAAPVAPERPADSAAKAEWVKFVVDSGGDPQWANDSATTKANLQAWEPVVGDTVAVSATEANRA